MKGGHLPKQIRVLDVGGVWTVGPLFHDAGQNRKRFFMGAARAKRKPVKGKERVFLLLNQSRFDVRIVIDKIQDGRFDPAVQIVQAKNPDRFQIVRRRKPNVFFAVVAKELERFLWRPTIE